MQATCLAFLYINTNIQKVGLCTKTTTGKSRQQHRQRETNEHKYTEINRVVNIKYRPSLYTKQLERQGDSNIGHGDAHGRG